MVTKEEAERYYKSLSPRQREDFERDLGMLELMLERLVADGYMWKDDKDPPQYYITAKGDEIADSYRLTNPIDYGTRFALPQAVMLLSLHVMDEDEAKDNR